jgi:hypothetical protein
MTIVAGMFMRTCVLTGQTRWKSAVCDISQETLSEGDVSQATWMFHTSSGKGTAKMFHTCSVEKKESKDVPYLLCGQGSTVSEGDAVSQAT